MITVKFNNESYNAYVKNYQTGEAEIKTSLVDIPYADGQLDLTDYYGKVRYKNRTVTINMRIFGSEDIVSIHHDIKNALHGKLAKVEFSDDDEGWYWYGRCSVGEGTRTNDYAYDFTITVDAEPYQYQDEETVLTIVSDDFVEDSEPYLYRASAVEGVEYDEIVGGSVGWNQLVINGNFATATGWAGRQSAFSVSNGIASITPSSDGTSRGLTGTAKIPRVQGHKYFMRVDVNSPINSTVNLSFSGATASTYNVVADTWVQASIVYESTLTGDAYFYALIAGTTTTSQTIQYKNANVVNLTLAFGSTIADYVYSLETATAGAGVSWLKEHFPKMFGQYNAYDAGSIKSVEGVSAHKMVGFNVWDEEWEVGGIHSSSGANVVQANTIRAKNIIPVQPSVPLYILCTKTGLGGAIYVFYYGIDGSYLGSSGAYLQNGVITPSADCHGIRFQMSSTYGITYTNDISINYPSTDHDYHAYETWSYPLDSSVKLNGLFKLDSNNKLYAEGDVWHSIGQIDRKDALVDLGTLDWAYNGSAFDNLREFATPLTGKANGVLNMICSALTVSSATGASGYKCIRGRAANTNISVVWDDMTVADFKTAMSGVYLVYELATPTTESATSYTNPQTVGTTEEYVTESIVPVGHNTKYLERKTVVLEGQNAGVLKVTNTMPVTLKKDSTSVTLTEGTHSVGIIPLQDGENEIEVTPTAPTAGTVTFNYSNGRL